MRNLYKDQLTLPIIMINIFLKCSIGVSLKYSLNWSRFGRFTFHWICGGGVHHGTELKVILLNPYTIKSFQYKSIHNVECNDYLMMGPTAKWHFLSKVDKKGMCQANERLKLFLSSICDQCGNLCAHLVKKVHIWYLYILFYSILYYIYKPLAQIFCRFSYYTIFLPF